jgi:hypothetical protein
LTGCVGQRYPKSLPDFNSHVGRDVIDFSRDIAHQIKTYDLKDAFAVSPGSHVDIFVVREFRDRFGLDACLLPHFPDGGILRLFAAIHQPFG